MTAPNDPFAPIAAHEFAVLTTYRKSGAAVPTTVWFAESGGKVYITTMRFAGKIKRLRADGRVQLAPSDRVGNLLGVPSVAGQARVARDDEREPAWAALAQKYGARWTQVVGATDDNPDRTYIIIEAA